MVDAGLTPAQAIDAATAPRRDVPAALRTWARWSRRSGPTSSSSTRARWRTSGTAGRFAPCTSAGAKVKQSGQAALSGVPPAGSTHHQESIHAYMTSRGLAIRQLRVHLSVQQPSAAQAPAAQRAQGRRGVPDVAPGGRGRTDRLVAQGREARRLDGSAQAAHQTRGAAREAQGPGGVDGDDRRRRHAPRGLHVDGAGEEDAEAG